MNVPLVFMIITSSVAPSAGCRMVRRYGKTGSEGTAFVSCASEVCDRASMAQSRDRIYLNVLMSVCIYNAYII